MRPYNDYYDELDDIDDFAFERSRAFQKLLDNYRREERDHHRNHDIDQFKSRRRPDNWDWDEDDGWN